MKQSLGDGEGQAVAVVPVMAGGVAAGPALSAVVAPQIVLLDEVAGLVDPFRASFAVHAHIGVDLAGGSETLVPNSQRILQAQQQFQIWRGVEVACKISGLGLRFQRNCNKLEVE